jgi:hypothetical protein
MEEVLSIQLNICEEIYYSPNGKQLAIKMLSNGYNNIHMYDINNGNFSLTHIIPLPPQPNIIHEICWNYVGNIIAYSICDYNPFSDTNNYSIKLWNVETNTELFTIDELMYMPNYDYGKISKITTMVWHPNENKLLYTNYKRGAFRKNSIIMFDCTTQTSNIIFSINYYVNIHSMNFSPNGEEIIFLRPKKYIDIYNFKLDKLINLDIINEYLYYHDESIVNFLCNFNLIDTSTISLKVHNLPNSEPNSHILLDLNETNKQCKAIIIIRNKDSSLSFDNRKIAYKINNSIIIYHLINSIILYTIDLDVNQNHIYSLCWSSIDDSIAIFTHFEIKIWKRRVLSDEMKTEIHYNEYTWSPENVVNNQNIDTSKFK